MSWRKLRGVHLSYEKQVYIRACCLLWREQPQKTQKKIERLCRVCGGAYAAALFEVMTTKKSVTEVALEHCVSESVLYELRKKFYHSW